MFAKQRILTILIKQTTFISPVSALSSLTLDLSPHDLKRCHLLLKKKKPPTFSPSWMCIDIQIVLILTFLLR